MGTDGLGALRAIGGMRLSLLLQRWAWGLTASLSALSRDADSGASAEVLEFTAAASLRYELLDPGRRRGRCRSAATWACTARGWR